MTLRLDLAALRRCRTYLGAALLSVGLTGCPGDQSLYDGHRGGYPADYKQKIKAAIESRWPAPRTFRVLAISQPHDGYVMRRGTFRAVYGAWLGCIRIEGDPRNGADFATLYLPYAIGSDATTIELRNEPGCRNADYEPWPDMIEGTEI